MQPLLSDTDLACPVLRPKLVKRVRISFIPDFTMDLKRLSVRELLDHCLGTDDQVAWNEFVERITPTIAGVVYRKLSLRGRPDPGLVQDLVQDTLVKLFDKDKANLKKFEWRHENAIYGYVKVIARRIVLDSPGPTGGDGGEELEKATEATSSCEADLHGKLQCAQIERRVEKLDASPMEKDIFWFYFKHGYTAREIGEMPGIDLDVKRIETILARLVRQLRDK